MKLLIIVFFLKIIFSLRLASRMYISATQKSPGKTPGFFTTTFSLQPIILIHFIWETYIPLLSFEEIDVC